MNDARWRCKEDRAETYVVSHPKFVSPEKEKNFFEFPTLIKKI
jgi:hypothetical protein